MQQQYANDRLREQMYLNQQNITANHKKHNSAHFQGQARDKKSDIQILTSHDPRVEYPVKVSQSTRNQQQQNLAQMDSRKISLKQPESTKNTKIAEIRRSD